MLRQTLLILAIALGLTACGGGGGATATPSPLPGGDIQGYPADVLPDVPAQATPEVVPTLTGYP